MRICAREGGDYVQRKQAKSNSHASGSKRSGANGTVKQSQRYSIQILLYTKRAGDVPSPVSGAFKASSSSNVCFGPIAHSTSRP